MVPLVYLLVHVFLGTTISAAITKSYATPLILLFVYWTLGFLSTGLDGTPLESLEYWTIGPVLGVLGVVCGTLMSNLFGVPRLLDALLMPNDGNKLTKSNIRRLAWEVAVLHLLTFLVFLAIKFISGDFSDDSTSTLAAAPSLAIGITLAVVAAIGIIVTLVVACMGQSHRFEKRQNVKYYVQHFLQVGLLPLLAITVLPCQASTWWVSLVYLAVALGVLVVAYIHTIKFTYFSGTFSRAPGVVPSDDFHRKPFFTGVLRYTMDDADQMGLLGDEEDDDMLYDSMVSPERALRFFMPILVLSIVVYLVDWVSLYWLCVTSALTHAIVLTVVALLFIVAVLITYFLLRRRDREVSENEAYPAFAASRIGAQITRLGRYANLKLH